MAKKKEAKRVSCTGCANRKNSVLCRSGAKTGPAYVAQNPKECGRYKADA
jgi:hypothetical protein